MLERKNGPYISTWINWNEAINEIEDLLYENHVFFATGQTLQWNYEGKCINSKELHNNLKHSKLGCPSLLCHTFTNNFIN